jgi:hypothetical protein
MYLSHISFKIYWHVKEGKKINSKNVKSKSKRSIFKKQSQKRPGLEYKMDPAPLFDDAVPGSNRGLNKKCIITGGDSGIGRAVAIAFAKEGADVAIIYLKEEESDARVTAAVVSDIYKRKCIAIAEGFLKRKIASGPLKKIRKEFKKIDVLVNNAPCSIPARAF